MDIPSPFEDEHQVNSPVRCSFFHYRVGGRGRRRFTPLLVLAALAGCGGPTAPVDSDLTGRWRGTVAALGIEFVTLDLVQTRADVTGTGQWTGTGGGTVTAIGLHFGTDLQLRMAFDRNGVEDAYVLPGRIEGPDEFYLLFPSDPPKRVTFTR